MHAWWQVYVEQTVNALKFQTLFSFCHQILSIWPRTGITGLDKQKFQRKIVNIFLPKFLAYVLGAQKNHLIETVILSTHNICFG